MFSTDKTLKKNLVVKKFSLLVLLSSLLCSCSKKEAENPGQSDAPKKSAASKPATKTELTSRTIEKLITIQNKINAFKRKHGSLPEMDAFGTSYDMWKGRIEFTLMKGNPDYDYMLRSKGPDKRKNTEDDIRVINSVTDNPKKKKTVRKNSSTENLLENLGSEKSPKAISIDDLPSSGLEEGGVELSIEDFEKLVDQKRNE